MNPGPVEEAGKAANSVIEALKATPIVLALVIFNVLFVVLAAYISIKGADRDERENQRWKELVENAMKWCPGTPSPYKQQ